MAHFCPDCKITFEKRIPNCPKCGYGIANDTQPEEVYIEQGYARFTYPQYSDNSIKVQDDDILKKLRESYKEYMNDIKETPPSQTPTQEIPIGNAAQTDFFSTFTNHEINTSEVNFEPDVQPIPEPIPTPQFEEQSRTNDYNTPQIFRLNRHNRTPVQIPWRAIAYLAIFIIVIVVVAVIWNMRFVILDSILNFIISLIPAILVIGVIVYLFRRLFRR